MGLDVFPDEPAVAEQAARFIAAEARPPAPRFLYYSQKFWHRIGEKVVQ